MRPPYLLELPHPPEAPRLGPAIEPEVPVKMFVDLEFAERPTIYKGLNGKSMKEAVRFVIVLTVKSIG